MVSVKPKKAPITHAERSARRRQIMQWRSEGVSLSEIISRTGLSLTYLQNIRPNRYVDFKGVRMSTDIGGRPVGNRTPKPPASQPQAPPERLWQEWRSSHLLWCKDYPGECSDHALDNMEIIDLPGPGDKYAILCQGKLKANYKIFRVRR